MRSITLTQRGRARRGDGEPTLQASKEKAKSKAAAKPKAAAKDEDPKPRTCQFLTYQAVTCQF